MIKKVSESFFVDTIDLFALKKCSILHIENVTNHKKIGYQAFNEYSADE